MIGRFAVLLGIVRDLSRMVAFAVRFVATVRAWLLLLECDVEVQLAPLLVVLVAFVSGGSSRAPWPAARSETGRG